MKLFVFALWLTGIVSMPLSTPAGPVEGLGYNDQTEVLPHPDDQDFCPGASFLQNDDGTFENGYAWRYGGTVPPDYGSWAECYEADFVCGIQLMLTQTGYYIGQTMDVYVWESVPEGNPPPGPDPGNALCVLYDVSPGPIAFWPEISSHNIQVCCVTNGDHFVGYWPNWPGIGTGWFIASDEDGPGLGCPRTKFAPGIGYPTGWGPPNLVPIFACKDLGIREFAGLGDCQPTAVRSRTWGRIKSLR